MICSSSLLQCHFISELNDSRFLTMHDFGENEFPRCFFELSNGNEFSHRVSSEVIENVFIFYQ